ncbi:MAG: O-antigen ligase family protein [Lewinellaceae bacterium]|nr:O-antigen ligase family protein [Lewinellaceae bacterium]
MNRLQLQRNTLLVLGIIFAVHLAVPAINPLVYVLLAAHALRGPKQTIEAFSIMFVVLMGNPGVFGGSGKSLRWLVIIAGFATTVMGMLGRGGAIRTDRNLLFIWFFFLAMLPTAILTSKIPGVSAFKLISFFMGAITVFRSFQATHQLQAYWKSWFYTLFVFIIGASLLAFPLGVGFLRNTRGFQGIFNHPQTLGPVCGILAAWFMSDYIFGKGSKTNFVLIFGITSTVMIFLSQARLGLAILGGSFILAYLLFYLNGRKVVIPRFGQNIIFAASLAFVFLLIYDFESISGFFTSFIQKRTQDAALSEAFYESRGFLVEASLQNFRDYPMLGIGFGVPTDYASGFRDLETFMGIPTGASIEKGFFPSALLEETGLIGALLTLALIISIIAKVNKKRDFPLMWFLLAVLLLNIGEAVFFSFGGLGLFDWLMLGFCYNQALSK